MIIENKFKKVGELTECSPVDFMREVQKTEPLFRYTSAEDMHQRFTAYFESLERFEYTVKDDNGKLLAMMVIVADFDMHLGQLCLLPTMTYSTEPGLLFGAYRFMFGLARERGIKWACVTKTDNHQITTRYKEIN